MPFAKKAREILIVLAAINVLLIIAHLTLHYLNFNSELNYFVLDLVDRFNLDHEASVPTWFAQTLLLAIASLLGWIGWQKHDQKNNKFVGHWLALSALFVFLSIDEGAEIHELAIEPFQKLFDITSGPLFFAWTIPIFGVLILLAILFAKFFWHLPKRTKLLVAIAIIIYLLGAMVMEMISGAYWVTQDFAYDMQYRIYNAFEEGLENFGLILGLYAILDYLNE